MHRPVAVLVLSVLVAGATGIFAPDVHAQDIDRPVIDIGVVVTDLARSVQFYEKVIGMTRTRSFDLDAGFGERSGLTDARPVRIEVLKVTDSPDGTFIELIGPLGQ